jgi:hypothetical protein
MNEKLLADRIAAIANPLDDSDWLDVQRRVRTTRWRPSRIVWVAAGLGAVLVLSGVALGLGQRVLDLSIGDPAPEPIQQAFDRFDQSRLAAAQVMRRKAGVTTRVDIQTEDARLVGRLRAQNRRRVRFWAAPTTRGWCYAVEYEQFRNPAHSFMDASCSRGEGFAYESHSYVGGRTFAGHVRPRVASLAIVFGNGQRRRVQLTNGFYLFWAPYSLTVRIIGRDSRGRVLFVRTDFA